MSAAALEANVRRPARDPLDAVVLLRPEVELRYDDQGRAQLRMLRPAQSSVGRFFQQTLGFQRPVRVNLDEVGTAYWNLIDDERDLHEFVDALGERFGWDEKSAEKAVVQFTRELMLRGLIQLRVEPAEGETL